MNNISKAPPKKVKIVGFVDPDLATWLEHVSRAMDQDKGKIIQAALEQMVDRATSGPEPDFSVIFAPTRYRKLKLLRMTKGV